MLIYDIIMAVKGSESFDRKHVLPALVVFVIITMSPLVMSVYLGAGNLINVLSNTENLVPLALDLALAAACALVSVLLALPGAHIIAKYRLPLKGLYRAICLLCLCTPVSILTRSYTDFESLLNFKAPFEKFNQAVALVISNAPLAVLIIASHWMALKDSLEESARTLGYSKAHVFRTVTLPYLRSAIVGSLALVFIRCISECMINSPIPGFAISLIALAIFCTSFFAKGKNSSIIAVHTTVRPSSFALRLLVFLYCLIMSVAVLAGPLYILYVALFPNGSLDASAFISLFSSTETSGFQFIKELGVIAVPSTLIAALLASRLAYCARRRMFPVYLSLIALGASLKLIYVSVETLLQSIQAIPPLAIAIITQTVLLIPIEAVVMLPRFRSIDINLKLQATTLGFGASKSFYSVEATLTQSAIIAAILVALAFCISSKASMPEFSSWELAACSTVISFILLLICSRLLRKKR